MPRRRAYPYKGASVNETIAAPNSPGSWVDEDSCSCGDTYRDFRCVAASTFEEAAQLLRARFRAADRERGLHGDTPAGWRTRGPVLWFWRCLKLGDWYDAHQDCGDDWDRYVSRYGSEPF